MQFTFEDNLHQLVENAPIGICIVDAATLVAETLNQHFADIAGRPAEAIQGKFYWDTFTEIRANYEPVMNGVIYEGKPYQAGNVKVTVNKGGQQGQLYIDFVYSPIKDVNGTVRKIAVWVVDKTAAVNAMKEQQQADVSQHRMHAIVESAPFPIAVYEGREMRVVMANQTIMDVWGKGYDVIGKTYADILPELAEQDIYQQLDAVFITGVPFHARNQRVDLVVDGRLQIFYFNYSFTPLFNADGSIYGVMNTAAEVTDLVVAKQRVEQSERDLHNMILQAPVAMCIMMGPEHIVAVANQLMIELWGKPAEAIAGKPIFEALPDARNQGLEELIGHVYHTGETFRANERPVVLERNGITETVYQNFVYQPYLDNGGNILGVIAITIDVTRQVTAHMATELALKDLAISEAKFRELIDNAPMGIAIYEGRNLIVDTVNEGMLKIWGKNTNVRGLPLAQALPEFESEGQPFIKLIKNVMESGELYFGYEAKALFNHNGILQEGFFDFILQPLNNDRDQVHAVLQVAIDVTQRVTARAELQRAEETLLLAVEAARIGIWHIETQGEGLQYNLTTAEIFGYESNNRLTLDLVYNQVSAEHQDNFARRVTGAIGRDCGFDITFAMRRFNDNELIWVRTIGKTAAEGSTDDAIFSGVVLDVTEQKHDELRKNDFIGMVSHELKTPLTSLTALVQLLHQKLKHNNDPFLAGGAEKAERQVKRMIALVNGFLNVSRLESGKIQLNSTYFNLTDLLKEVINETDLTTPSHQISLLQADDITIWGDKDKIGSVISNLLSNAIKYSPRGKHIEVRCQTLNNKVLVSVRDEGMGIKQQDRDRLFERYYRVETKHTQHISGFGIGLYLCQEILQLHGGRIWVESESGVGSTFYFELPVK